MNQPLSEQIVSHPLLPLESSWLLMEEPGIAAVTFYEGAIDLAAELLHKRLTALLKANPWLLGRLTKNQNSKQLFLTFSRYFNEESAASEIILFKPDGLLFELSEPYVQLCKKASACVVSKGRLLLVNQEPLVKLSLVPVLENHNSKFAVVFSVSHVIADGYTFYALLNSLFSSEPPPILEPTRELTASASIPVAVGEKEYKYIFSAKFLCNVMRGLLLGSSPKILINYIDRSLVDAEKIAFKKRASDSNAFISMNDILTSGFIRAVKSRLCMCAINLRNRVQQIGFQHAGNYEAALLFDYEKAKSPEGIRKTLSNGPPFSPTQTKLPGFLGGVFCRMSLITNWATFTGDLSLPDCKQIIHLPLHATPNKMPFDCAIVFEPNPDQTAIIVFARKVTIEKLRQFLPLGKAVFE